jgi:hypothetical protein
MKARTYLWVMVFAAGWVTASAQEIKTNAVPGAAEVASPPPATAPATSTPAVAKEAKPPAVGIPTPASPVPTQPKITTTPRMASAEGAVTSHKELVTNPPPAAAAVPEEVKPPGEGVTTPTNAAPAETETSATATPNATAPPPESSGLDRKTTLLIGAAILLVAGGLAFFMWRRASVVSHGSLISSALSLTKYDDKNEEKAGEKGEAGTEVTRKAETEPKKEEKIFPPPMN